jgi:hypothetical protein
MGLDDCSDAESEHPEKASSNTQNPVYNLLEEFCKQARLDGALTSESLGPAIFKLVSISHIDDSINREIVVEIGTSFFHCNLVEKPPTRDSNQKEHTKHAGISIFVGSDQVIIIDLEINEMHIIEDKAELEIYATLLSDHLVAPPDIRFY